MNENKFTTHNGKQVEFRFASLLQVKKVGGLLGIDILRDGVTKLDFANLLEDEKKLLEVLGAIVQGEVKESMLDDFTLGDLQGLILGFFLKGKTLTVKFENGLSGLSDIINLPLGTNHQQDTSLTSQSIPVVKEIPKR